MARLFFGLWPNDEVRAALTRWGEAAHEVAGGRITPSRNLHMTLVFLGETDPRRLADLEQAASAVRIDPCVLTLDRCAYWKHNRIVWAGGEAPGALSAAVGDLREALSATGARFDSKPFVPHVSLLRNAKANAMLPSVVPIAWPASDFVLLASGRDAAGSVYRMVAGPFGRRP